MRIEGIQTEQLQQLYNRHRKMLNQDSGEVSRQEVGDGRDSMEISTEAQEMQEISSRLEEVTARRSERVAEIKEEIDGGTYQVSNEELAEALLDELELLN